MNTRWYWCWCKGVGDFGQDFVLYRDGVRTDWQLVHCGILGMDLAVYHRGQLVAGPYVEPREARIKAEELAEQEE